MFNFKYFEISLSLCIRHVVKKKVIVVLDLVLEMFVYGVVFEV